jgi:hypothetical protein
LGAVTVFYNCLSWLINQIHNTGEQLVDATRGDVGWFFFARWSGHGNNVAVQQNTVDIRFSVGRAVEKSGAESVKLENSQCGSATKQAFDQPGGTARNKIDIYLARPVSGRP